MSITKLMMAAFCATFFVLCNFAEAQAPAPARQFVLLTDVDDTIKVSHVADTVNKVIRFLSDPEAFAGMSELYTAMLEEAHNRNLRANFIVLSGTPSLLESAVFDFLETFNFPRALRVITRPFLMDTLEYKTEAVTVIVGHPVMKDAQIVLIGDDTELDFEAYSNSLRARTTAPGLESQIYIRRVKGTAQTTAESIAFDSAADIAIAEFMKGRLSKTATEEIFSVILKENSFEKLFVPGEYCPGKRSPRLSDDLKSSAEHADLVQRFVRVENHLRERCAGLNAVIAGVLE